MFTRSDSDVHWTKSYPNLGATVDRTHAILRKLATPKNYVVLMAIYEHPGAKKEELARVLDWPPVAVDGPIRQLSSHSLVVQQRSFKGPSRCWLTREGKTFAIAIRKVREVDMPSVPDTGPEANLLEE